MSDVHAMVTELTRAHVVGTAYQTFRDGELHQAWHYTKAPALLVQLQHATPTPGTDRNNPGYGSRPAAHIEALDTLLRIDNAAARWLRDLGHDDPGNTIRCVTLVGSLHPSAGDYQKAIGHDIRSWWNQARITTGYDSPAWRPDNTCPLCSERGTLRIKLANRAGLCVGCFEAWDESTIALLADHIRFENADQTEELPTEGDAA